MTREQAALLLGVDPDASADQVNCAWRVWVKLAHPDAGGDRGHFEALADARSLLLSRPRAHLAQQSRDESEHSPAPRASLRSMFRRPSARGLFTLTAATVLNAVALLVSGHLSNLGAAAAVGIATSFAAVVVQRTCLITAADTGHRIAVLVLVWLPLAGLMSMSLVLQGVEIVGFLPIVALPFVVVVASVNPGAGLWRPVRLPS